MITEYDKDQQTQTRETPKPVKPDTIRILADMFNTYLQKYKKPPFGHNRDTREAAHQWVKLQETPSHGEAPHIVSMRKGGSTWNTPYLDRLKQNLNIFMHLSQETQQIIVDAKIEHSVHWRGETMDMFKRVLDQYTKTG